MLSDTGRKEASMPFDRTRRALFDQSADDYDAARPGYPDRLLDALLERSAVPNDGRILEIGCGTGQLTIPLAARSYAVDAVELGENLARLAERNLAPFPNAAVFCADFEAWSVEPTTYDLVVSAQAFHWIDPAVGYPKVHAALRPSGSLALVWNLFPGCDDPLHRALDKVCRSVAPQLVNDSGQSSFEERVDRTIREIRGSRRFEEPDIVRVPWTSTYTTARYLRLLRTHSDHLALDPSMSERLLDAVESTIDRFGGTLERPQVATLVHARPLRGVAANEN
jgi:SAM-dependent methyltransferase